jgi:integrase
MKYLANTTPLLDKLLNPPTSWEGIPDDVADAAREFSRKILAADTARCYEGILQQWMSYRGGLRAAFPAKEAPVIAWIVQQFKAGLSPFTIRNKLIVLATVHRCAGWPSIYTFAVRQTLRAAFRNYNGTRQRKRPITREHRLQIAKRLRLDRNRLRAARDGAILNFGFVGALRRSEIASACVENLYLEPEGLIYEIRKSKGDPYGEGQSVSIRADAELALCPVRAVADWLRISGITAGPIFREITADGVLGSDPLTPDSIARIVKDYAILIGLDPQYYAGHSLRRGWATHAHKTGASMESLMRHLRHSSLNFTRVYVDGPSPGDINFTRGSGA